mmetsp:Transcript_56129/g.121454  ORF Transcript_56129/g.121454 Transcript_56129/m.121454 type:complete len:495 (+) Transcript_56129:70-1554(+)|eukprot:CAMPEP_0170578950 /NCGR_PEP_ID=MMETSP0224-20130122/5729_1 /TAXON_ID=285029 /ORGANISM="Togula jolla, Strain CCCM 725" /LENGTH=494 /DNA_ID=CAMNT_0010901953 /DNA_START=70 /DNA_END=1554 /DNA_ORIENTATION=+
MSTLAFHVSEFLRNLQEPAPRASASLAARGVVPTTILVLTGMAVALFLRPSELPACPVDPAASAGLVGLKNGLPRSKESCGIEADGESLSPIAELHAQLKYHSERMESAMGSSDDVDALFIKSRKLFEVLQSLDSRCEEVSEELRSIRAAERTSHSTVRAMSGFHALHGLEEPFREALAALEQSATMLGHRMAIGDMNAEEEFAELIYRRSASRSCLIGAVREARSLAALLPQKDLQIRQAMRCSPSLLLGIETLAIGEAERDGEPITTFGLGLYWSEVSLSGHDVPFLVPYFEPPWVQDGEGLHVPGHLGKAEELLMLGEQLSVGQERKERAATLALRLYQHAKFLALKHHDAAAEWRYRAASRVAAESYRPKLAAHSLARLGYLLMLRGRQQEAIDAAEEALTFSNDKVAGYILGLLRRSAGGSTAEELQRAEELLQEGGQLPSKFEALRSGAHSNLVLWRQVDEAKTMGACFELQDAAYVLICLLGRASFG